jgi:hypothetical protein
VMQPVQVEFEVSHCFMTIACNDTFHPSLNGCKHRQANFLLNTDNRGHHQTRKSDLVHMQSFTTRV